MGRSAGAALWGGHFGGYLPAMLADDLAADAEFDAGAATAFWTDEVWLENRRQLISWDQPAIIRHFDDRRFGFLKPRGNPDQLAKAILRGVLGEQQQIYPQAFQLALVAHDGRQFIIQLDLELDAGVFDTRADQR